MKVLPEIEHYKFGSIHIDGKEYTRDVIVLPDRVVPNWRRNDGHNLVLADLEAVLDELPVRLIIGQGHEGRMRVPESTTSMLESRGFELWTGSTPEAIAQFNVEQQGVEAALLLHLTC